MDAEKQNPASDIDRFTIGDLRERLHEFGRNVTVHNLPEMTPNPAHSYCSADGGETWVEIYPNGCPILSEGKHGR